MARDTRNLLEVLRSELKFLRAGGYARQDTWRFSFVFEDSPSCLRNFVDDTHAECRDCILMALVPPTSIGDNPVPCRLIPLDSQGTTLEALYRTGSREEIFSALERWLAKKIAELEATEQAHTVR